MKGHSLFLQIENLLNAARVDRLESRTEHFVEKRAIEHCPKGRRRGDQLIVKLHSTLPKREGSEADPGWLADERN